MPGCSAVGCNNRSEKGYVMKCFPREPHLRQLWKERVNRADWEPSNNSFLCHVHFEPNQWMIAEHGIVKLKRDAVPSVFKIATTYKKSHKKVLKQIDDDCEYNFIREHSEGEIGQSSSTSGTLEDKDSDSQDIDPLHLFLYPRENRSSNMTEDIQASDKQSTDTSNLHEEDTVVISDDDVEMSNSVKECCAKKTADTKESSNDQNDSAAKLEIVPNSEPIATCNDSYDEIEEKLKQICDGDRDESVPDNEEPSATRNDQKNNEATKVSLYGNVDSKYLSSTGINDSRANDAENVETIFGSESGEECGRLSNDTSRSNDTTNEIDKSDNIVNNKDGEENAEGLDVKSLCNEDSRVAGPHEKIAMKRKTMSPDEMTATPAKRPNQSVSFSQNSMNSTASINDVSDDIGSGTNNETLDEELDVSLYTGSNENSTVMLQLPSAPKFTIKVTGDRDSVSDIMGDVFKDRDNFTIHQEDDTDTQQESSSSGALVTSVVMMDDELTEEGAKADTDYDTLQDSTLMDNIRIPSYSSPLNEDGYLRSTSPHFDEETNDRSSECATPDINSMLEQPMVNHTIKYEYRRLQQKVKIQEDVIKELTNQLIKYKDMEKDMRNKRYMLDLKLNKVRNMIATYDANAADGASSAVSDKKTVSLQKKVFDELSFTATYVEEANKRLRERLNLETESKKQLESEIKQKDAKLKELNWKLEKASKFLDRSEKNTNKYKRKMLNMQNFLKRRKLADQEISKLGILLLDKKGNCSRETYEKAMEIKAICGEKGYEKLLNFGFPFPEPTVLRIMEESLKSSDSFRNIARGTSSDIKKYEHDVAPHATNHKLQSDVNDDSIESDREPIVKTSSVMIMGTVQDIFEESNDMSDFNEDEIKEDFILQLDSNQ